MPRLLLLALASAVTAALPLQPIVSQPFTTVYAGTTVDKPLQAYRPDGSSSSVAARRFDVFAFQVDVGGSYRFENEQVSPTNWDHMFHLYADCFDPLSPFTNLVVFRDLAPIILDNFALESDRKYIAVTTGYSSATGSYSLEITGPSTARQVTCSSCATDDPADEPPVASVPEPGSGLLLLSAAGMMWLVRLRRPRSSQASR